MALRRINVNIPGKPAYPVRIGAGILPDIGDMLLRDELVRPNTAVMIVTDTNVAPLYLATVRGALTRSGFTVSDVVIEAGESSKSVEVASQLWEAMATLGLGRDALVVALGGGVVGDLAGFVASTYMRSIPFVGVPTTLLAMVDSSVGGKTAIDLTSGKNLVGTFQQPLAVFADGKTLATLPQREWACGMAELVKSAIIDGDDFFFTLCDEQDVLGSFATATAADIDNLLQLISRAVIFKAGVVAADVEERAGVRQCLNYGHTLGHAVELLEGLGARSHGACVAEGMRFAAWVAQRKLGAPPELAEAQNGLLDAVGLPQFPVNATAQELLSAMKRDKKARGGRIQMVLLRDVGQWTLETMGDEEIVEAIDEWRTA